MMTRAQRETIEIIRLSGEPLTREAFVGVWWNDEPPDDWGAEEEAELPDFLQGADPGRVFDIEAALAGDLDR